MISPRQIISESAGSIFAIFTPNESVWVQMIDLKSFFNISSDVAAATKFVSYQTCSLGVKVSQDPPDRFSQSLHHMVGITNITVSIALQMINPTFFFRYLKGRCHGSQLKLKISVFLRSE